LFPIPDRGRHDAGSELPYRGRREDRGRVEIRESHSPTFIPILSEEPAKLLESFDDEPIGRFGYAEAVPREELETVGYDYKCMPSRPPGLGQGLTHLSVGAGTDLSVAIVRRIIRKVGYRDLADAVNHPWLDQSLV
jgi:hypothetical protein